MLTIVLTRHGSTARSEPEQHLGQRIDIPLSNAGRVAASALGRRLAGVAFDRIVASPLRRAVETAELIAPGALLERDPRLMEMDYGRWEGRTYAEIEAIDGAARRRWEANPAELRCPGGESGNDVASRVERFLGDLEAWSLGGASDDDAGPAGGSAGPTASRGGEGGERRVLVVAHSTTNRVLLCVAMAVPIADYRRRFIQAPANLTVLRYDPARGPGACLLVCNDVSHIKGTRGTTWG